MISREIKYPLVVFIPIITYSITLYYIVHNFLGFPEMLLGVDAMPHSAKINMIKSLGLETFRWFPSYYFGNPHFTFYTPSTYVLPATIAILFNLDYLQIIQLLNWMVFFSTILVLTGVILLLLSILNKNNDNIVVPIIGASIFLVSSPGLLEPWLWGGNYPEALSLPTIPWSLLLIEKWLRTNKNYYFFGYLVLASFSIVGHQAVGSFLILSTILWILSDEINWKTKMKRIILLLIFSIGLSMVYVGPLLYFELTTKIRPSIVEDIPYPFSIGDYFPVFTLLELPLLPMITRALPGSPIFLFFIYYVYYLVKRDHKVFKKRVILISVIPILLTVHFFLATQKVTPWIAGFHPARYLILVVMFSSIVIGIILSNIKKKYSYIFLLLITLVMSLYFVFPPSYQLYTAAPPHPEDFKLVNELQASIFYNQFRIGGIKDGLFNIVLLLRPDYYTSRGYYAQGILYFDWQYWFEYTLSHPHQGMSHENTLMHLLDWGAVRYIGVTRTENSFETISRRFKVIGNISDFIVFENELASPIAEVVYDGGVLYIGDYEGYDVVLRSIAMSSYVKPAPVIVWAEGKCIDDVPLSILEKFSSIILYRYCYRDREKAFNLIEQYVSRGGRLFIESMSSIDESSEMPPPIPIYKTYRTAVENDWNLSIVKDLLTEDITIDVFSPPIYDGGPWGVSSSSLNDLRSGAKALLISGNKVLVAYIKYGDGVVVWSGMNLPYHVLAYQNTAEANFMRKLITYNITTETEPVQMVRNSATSITFKVPPEAKGLVFRERYISNLVFSWKASDSKREFQVFMMGPGFNYIVIEDGSKEVKDIKFMLQDGPLRMGSMILSISTIFLLTVTLIFKHFIKKHESRSLINGKLFLFCFCHRVSRN